MSRTDQRVVEYECGCVVADSAGLLVYCAQAGCARGDMSRVKSSRTRWVEHARLIPDDELIPNPSFAQRFAQAIEALGVKTTKSACTEPSDCKHPFCVLADLLEEYEKNGRAG